MTRVIEATMFAILAGTVAFLIVIVWNMRSQIIKLNNQNNNSINVASNFAPIQPGENFMATPIAGESATISEGKQEINDLRAYFDSALATISATSQTVIKEVQTNTQTSAQTSYVPMGSTATTTNTDWIDVADSKVYIDLNNDYGENAVVSWEASLKVAHSNGKAYARLFDETNGIAVSGSELTVENSDAYVQKASAYLPFWRGRNLYKVQIKSLNSFEVTYSSGKIKIQH